MTPTKIFQPTDLRRDRSFIDFAREYGRAFLRDSEGGSAFVLVAEDELAGIERSAKRSQRLSEVAQALVTLAALRRVPDPWAWLEAFEFSEQQEFGREAIEALRLDLSDPDSNALGAVVESWRETAAAIRDADRHAALTAPVELDEAALSEPDYPDGD